LISSKKFQKEMTELEKIYKFQAFGLDMKILKHYSIKIKKGLKSTRDLSFRLAKHHKYWLIP
jgi:hypothetical protein